VWAFLVWLLRGRGRGIRFIATAPAAATAAHGHHLGHHLVQLVQQRPQAALGAVAGRHRGGDMAEGAGQRLVLPLRHLPPRGRYGS
jgi:hypothetical protein